MIDVETLSTKPDAAIIQLAAVMFNFSNNETETFCMNCSIQSSVELGLSVDKDTLVWWKNQPKEVLKSVTDNPHPIQTVFQKFDEFLGENKSSIVFWCNGMNFDYPVIESTCRALDRPVFWKYWNLRDARTVYSVFGLNMKEFPRVGNYHNALDDCLTQINALKQCLS